MGGIVPTRIMAAQRGMDEDERGDTAELGRHRNSSSRLHARRKTVHHCFLFFRGGVILVLESWCTLIMRMTLLCHHDEEEVVRLLCWTTRDFNALKVSLKEKDMIHFNLTIYVCVVPEMWGNKSRVPEITGVESHERAWR